MSHQYGARQHKLAGSCYREGALMGCTDPPHEVTKTKTKKEGGVVTYSGVFAARGPELLHPHPAAGPLGVGAPACLAIVRTWLSAHPVHPAVDTTASCTPFLPA